MAELPDFEQEDWMDDPFDREAFEIRATLAESHPLFIQAGELEGMLQSLLSTCRNSEGLLRSERETLRQLAKSIKKQLFRALLTRDYLASVTGAAIIREQALSLEELIALLRHDHFDKHYLTVFAAGMEKFRELFRDWMLSVKDLKKTRKDEDVWGLF